MKSLKIQGELRKETGKKAAKNERAAGLVPCEMYSKSGNIHFTVAPMNLKPLVYSPDFQVVDLEIEGQIHQAIMKSIQFDPVSDEIVHIDFLKLQEGRKVKIEVPVRFSGVSPGVKAGGKLLQKVRTVQIKAAPEHLVDEVVLDISDMKLGQSIRVRDIKLDSAIEVVNSPGIPLATITIPRALKGAGES